jgi:hypothetical protein
LEFEAGQVLAQALVHAEPECDMVAGIPAHVEGLRLRKDLGIVVGRTDWCDDSVTSVNADV